MTLESVAAFLGWGEKLAKLRTALGLAALERRARTRAALVEITARVRDVPMSPPIASEEEIDRVLEASSQARPLARLAVEHGLSVLKDLADALEGKRT